MDAISHIFAGVTQLWLFGISIVILTIVGSAVSYFIKHPKASVMIVFFTLLPYVLAISIAAVLHSYIGGWSLVIGFVVWAMTQSMVVNADK